MGFFKNIIEKSSIGGMNDYYKSLDAYINSQIPQRIDITSSYTTTKLTRLPSISSEPRRQLVQTKERINDVEQVESIVNHDYQVFAWAIIALIIILIGVCCGNLYILRRLNWSVESLRDTLERLPMNSRDTCPNRIPRF